MSIERKESQAQVLGAFKEFLEKGLPGERFTYFVGNRQSHDDARGAFDLAYHGAMKENHLALFQHRLGTGCYEYTATLLSSKAAKKLDDLIWGPELDMSFRKMRLV
jgi:hypothetical protein